MPNANAEAPGAVITLDFEQIRALLIHRFPLLMLDRVICLEPGLRLVARKNVTGNEIWFLGHFPEKALMPGVLMIEAMAQAACLLDTVTRGDARPAVAKFLGHVKAEFVRPVFPGDVMEIEVTLVRQFAHAVIAKGSVRVDGAKACSAELTLGTTAFPGAGA